jgi:cell fate regulator YaaT (PSP1 superfamily)
MTQDESPKPKGHKPVKKLMLARYGRMGLLGWFEHNLSNISKIKTKIIIKTPRGMELGDVVGPFNYKAGHFKSSCEQVDKYFCKRTKEYPLAGGGTFVRYATREDLMEAKHLEASSRDELKCCGKFIKEMNLDMKVVDAEHLFGGERIVVYFTSNGRVDFRELVKRLAREYQTRIEMRQIGSRDEAKLISDFESCGQECCCKRFLKILEPVNMRMAKLQKATLDPSKISGHCGRLKCCLRYEDDIYRELKAKMPKKNAIVKTPSGEGKVLNMQYLTQLIVVQFEDGRREAFGLEDLEILQKNPQNQNNNPRNNNRNNNARNNNRRQEQNSKEKKTPENPEPSQPVRENKDAPRKEEDKNQNNIKKENNQNNTQDNSNKQEQ